MMPAGDVNIIKLQLRKPKAWNWELTTSKSSPHIALPTIQLYNAKGQLLIEAKDHNMKRLSWSNIDRASNVIVNHVQRCRSDIIKNPLINVRASKPREGNQKIKKSKSEILPQKSNNVPHQQNSLNYKQKAINGEINIRSRAEILERLRKCSEESLKRAMADGYQKFLIPPTDAEKKKAHTRCKSLYGKIDENEQKPDINHLTHKRYKTRTSSAGTLIVDESFNNNYRRRPAIENNPTSWRVVNDHPNTLFQSCSTSECNYIVQEPITPVRDNGNGREKRRAKLRRTHSIDSTSSSAAEKRNRTKVLTTITNKSKPKELPQNDNKEESRLLELIKRLSTDHVKMGANVSRYSSKGLSGRRSQSSGSICNGKGRHGSTAGNDKKICSSLPGYLDDKNKSCNNNLVCEKPPLDERLPPPLGDGAPLHWKFADNQVVCDQGYGSERSPEEEYPPPLPEHDSQCHRHLEPHTCYPFITPESTFAVSLSKGSRGLGLSVTGGIDSTGSWPGLIRVKRLFPHQLAAACGQLNVGDIILEANGVTLTGLTNYEAVEVLRTTPNQVELKVCRPPPDVLSCVSPISEVPPPPPRREPPASLNLLPEYSTTPEDEFYHGEFEVTLTKIQGSLGFTLRKEDDSALGHYIRALVREPAFSDGRIRAGDKIIAVNDVEISSMSHEQAVQFLRQCGDVVKLRLYRDFAQTPVSAFSPKETTPRTSRKIHLRQEAVDMLNDLAVKKLLPGNNQEQSHHSMSPSASPRRLRRSACPSDASHIDISNQYVMNEDQFHEGLLQKCSGTFDDESFNSLFYVDSDETDKPSRPSSLDLYNPNRTPVAARKPKFNFSLAHNAYELNNLDADVLDAPNLTYNLGAEDGGSAESDAPKEPASMPHIPTNSQAFSYKNPAYQSAHPQCISSTEGGDGGREEKDESMKKWKGVVFNADGDGESDKEGHPMNGDCEILAIELVRGWNSRLGFSLQGAAGYTYVSAVHADSVAARDGRLKPGDRLVKVNDESVENMSTSKIIDLLRIVRGPVCIVVSRQKTRDCTNKEN